MLLIDGTNNSVAAFYKSFYAYLELLGRFLRA